MSRSVPVPVRLIGGLQLLGGGLTILYGLALTLDGLVGFLTGRSTGGFMAMSASELFVFALVVGALVIGVGSLGVVTGAGLCRGRSWARSVVVTLSLLHALVVLSNSMLLPALIPLSIAGYLGLSEDVARAFRA